MDAPRPAESHRCITVQELRDAASRYFETASARLHAEGKVKAEALRWAIRTTR